MKETALHTLTIDLYQHYAKKMKSNAAGYFDVPLVDLGDADSALRGIYTPLPEVGTKKVGITDQFLANASQYHQKYSNEGHFARLFHEAFANIGGAPAAMSILDIGTGSGANTIGPLISQAPDCQIIATDLSPNLLSILQHNLLNQGLEDRVSCICTDAMRNYFKESSFDMVVGAAILHHLIDPVDALHAAYRALKPGGLAIWFEPFEAGIRMVRLLYKLIIKQHEAGVPLKAEVATGLRALILDADVRAGTDRGAPHFENMDDKWLFTREYVEDAAVRSGFRLDRIIPHTGNRHLYRNYIEVEFGLLGLSCNDMPWWAWELVDVADSGFSDVAKKDFPPEATIILSKPRASVS